MTSLMRHTFSVFDLHNEQYTVFFNDYIGLKSTNAKIFRDQMMPAHQQHFSNQSLVCFVRYHAQLGPKKRKDKKCGE